MTVAEETAELTITNINDVRHDFIVPTLVKGEVVEYTLDDNSSPLTLLLISQNLPKSDSDINREVRRRLASHPNTPSDALRILSTDRQAWVRRAVASHPKATQDVLVTLSTDKSSDVRVAIAKNWNTPTSALETLSSDESSTVRLQAFEHPEMSTETLLRSLHEKSAVVYQRVLENLVRRAYPEANVRD